MNFCKIILIWVLFVSVNCFSQIKYDTSDFKKNYKLIIPVNEAVEDIIAKEEMKKKLRPNYVATL